MESMVDRCEVLMRVITTVNSLGATDGEGFDSKCIGSEVAAATDGGETTATGKDSKGVGDAFAAEAKCCAAAGQQPVITITAIISLLSIWVDSKRRVKSVVTAQFHYFSCANCVGLLPPGTVFRQQEEHGNCPTFT
jgi:hypothetical protein